ncbi:hypothetical protein Tco_0107265, partial [Tanacetum coccineum]
MQQLLPNNNYNLQPSFNENYVQQTMINLDNISDPTITMNMALALMAKAFKLSTLTNNNKRISSNPRNRQIAQPESGCRDAAYLQTQLLIAQKEEAKIQLQAKEYDLMSIVADIDEIEEVNANCILMANLQQASTSGTQTDKALMYDSDGSAEDQYYELREPIPESHLVQQNDSDVITAA